MAGTIAITGATGFVGAAVAKRLTAAGYRVQALIRPASFHKQRADMAVDWTRGDLGDMQGLKRLVNGVDAVIHCAGAVRGTTENQFNGVNVEGSARLVQAISEQHPKPRFLMISSLAAREPHLSHYAGSKRRGEKLLTEQAHPFSWTIYRPCAVYGPEDREIMPLLKLMAKGMAPVVGSGNGRFSLIFVNDLAEAVVKWADKDCCHCGTYELHDGHPGGYSWHEVINTMKHLRSRMVVQLRMPIGLVRIAAALNLMAARIIGYAPMLTPGKVRELIHPDWTCDNAALESAAGWSPRVLLPEGLRLTLGWSETQ